MFQLIIFCFLFNQFLRYCSLWFSAETTRYDGYNKHDRIEALAFWGWQATRPHRNNCIVGGGNESLAVQLSAGLISRCTSPAHHFQLIYDDLVHGNFSSLLIATLLGCPGPGWGRLSQHRSPHQIGPLYTPPSS